MKARGNTKKILHDVAKIQGLIGQAKACHDNDVDPKSHAAGQEALKEAFELCVEIRSMYEPE